ncbi:hypothetical protein ACFYV7_23415 [Nocardia suismassiliense]|uniref:Uncharacterized protein n=1 Tax=Nocardia suismassiliense TaxID=2077092 RepID=A0ABW6QWX0_9NOCA
MEPVAMVVAAVAAGAATGLTGTAERAVADAYQAVKRLIVGRYRPVDVAAVEREPQSAACRAVLIGELAQAGAGDDEELLAAAGQVLVAVQHYAPQVAETVGVRLREIHAGELEITDVTVASGAGLIAEKVSVDGSFTIRGVRADGQSPHPPLAQQE